MRLFLLAAFMSFVMTYYCLREMALQPLAMVTGLMGCVFILAWVITRHSTEKPAAP